MNLFWFFPPKGQIVDACIIGESKTSHFFTGFIRLIVNSSSILVERDIVIDSRYLYNLGICIIRCVVWFGAVHGVVEPPPE